MALIALVAYVSLYTWNWKTGVLDRIAVASGLEFVGSVLAPGRWAQREVTGFWDHYIHLVGLRQENDLLHAQVNDFRLQLVELRERAAQADRLLALLHFSPPRGWEKSGARIVGHRVGPNAILQTILIDRGTSSGVVVDTPVATAKGLVGRVHRPGIHFSQVLLVIDPNSHVPVLGAKSRIPAIVEGQGPDQPLLVKYVPLNDSMDQGELLITSGLGGIFPKGLPVGRVRSVTHSSLSLFQTIHADPIVQPGKLEELLILAPQNATRRELSLSSIPQGKNVDDQGVF